MIKAEYMDRRYWGPDLGYADWVDYGYGGFISQSYWIVPGTIDPSV